MEPYDAQDYNGYYSHSAPRYMSSRNSNYYNNYPPQQYYDEGMPPPLPPTKPKKKSVLKSPLTAIKNALIKGTRPLRRMNSMVEPERKSAKSALKRQHSLLERQMQRPYYPDEFPTYPAGFEQQYREPIYSQQPQYYNTYHQRTQYDDYGTYQNLESEDIYGNIPRQRYVPPTTPYENEEIYANRALIDLERRQAVAMAGRNGRGIVRRHSTTTADRAGMRRSPAEYKQQMQNAHPQAPNSEVMSRRRFYPPTHTADMQELQQLDEPVYQTRREMQREMQRNHLYQSRQEMQQRIQQGKREMEREFSTHSSSSQSEREESLPERRQELKDSASRTRAQLREKIYQTRRDAMESMAEPIYVSKRDNTKRPEPIYECKEELLLHSRENETDEKKKVEKSEVVVEINHTQPTEIDVDLQQSTDTIVAAEQTVLPAHSETLTATVALAPLVQSEELEDELVASVEDLQITAVPNPPKLHINQVIPPPPPPTAAPAAAMNSISQLSLSTQASIPSGVPNATSTPYTSNMSLPVAGPVNPVINHQQLFPALPREAKTTRGVFDSTGGTLSDTTWHVSLEIPAGAIPEGVRQEIYFTVSDPRMGESVGGPPLDMENGETMLSPLVMCGPQGLEFLVPVTLNIPHCAGRTASLGLALKATDSEKQLHTEWDNIDLPSNAAAHTVSVKVDHF